MFRLLPLIVLAALLEAVGITGTIAIDDTSSKLFFMSQRGIDAGILALLLAMFLYRRRSIESAYEVGLEVGQRRGRKAARNGLANVLSLQDHPKARVTLPPYDGDDRESV